MVEYVYYEEESNEKIIGICVECGCAITLSMDHYDFNVILICEECKDAFMDNFFEEGIDEI